MAQDSQRPSGCNCKEKLDRMRSVPDKHFRKGFSALYCGDCGRFYGYRQEGK